MERSYLNIMIGGHAGQGLVTIGQVLSKALVRNGYSIVVTQSYQSRIRGGHNTFVIRASTSEISAPQETLDILVALDADTVTGHREELSSDGIVIADKDLKISNINSLNIPYGELAPDKLFNVVALGSIASVIGLSEKSVAQALDDHFEKKDESTIKENRRVLIDTFLWVEKNYSSIHKLATIENPQSRIMINGNEAIALGALQAGVKFCSFYPMTPATSIALNLAHDAREMGLIVEQAEDEIAAINMAIGAFYAGAPSVVTTSGGGFALMVEGVSLSAMTETPIVIVVAQRPGPATGLPTRTEQADLEFVLHAGHGEFPIAILAPGSIEECFHLTRRAFDLALRYQGPMFILTDQYLADSYRAVKPLDLDNLSQIQPTLKAESVSSFYYRYAITESGVSPRLIPGMTENLVVVDSDEHTVDGHITEDLSIRKEMVEKRLKKGEGIKKEVIPPEMDGDDNPDILLISWGSTKGAVKEASEIIRSNGIRTSTLHFSQVWPLVSQKFLGYLERAKRVVCVESNATGQFARLIRRETGFEIENRVLRFDGLPITPDYIIGEVNC
ncbi:MAG: 2-oxoacid:acceptor oxidoreductase subunit alpha [Spirochaetota bacterium]|nr:2-oxoacid:acceptor oxidoreductase subunit alpha [Spirochaetota bacterium]